MPFFSINYAPNWTFELFDYHSAEFQIYSIFKLAQISKVTTMILRFY